MTDEKKQFFGMKVLITGSSRGIGRAIALVFAADGARVIVHASKKSIHAQQTLKDVKQISPTSELVLFDVADRKAVKKECARMEPVDILINNAGIVANKRLVDMSYEEWDRVISTNLTGTFLVTKEIVPQMIKKNSGRIINISSISAERGDFGQTNYSASKAGIIGLTKSLAKEVARHNITVNAVCPGLVDTDILRDVPKDYMDAMIGQIPLRRKATPAEIANVVLFLASPKASYITGSVVHVNGGWR